MPNQNEIDAIDYSDPPSFSVFLTIEPRVGSSNPTHIILKSENFVQSIEINFNSLSHILGLIKTFSGIDVSERTDIINSLSLTEGYNDLINLFMNLTNYSLSAESQKFIWKNPCNNLIKLRSSLVETLVKFYIKIAPQYELSWEDITKLANIESNKLMHSIITYASTVKSKDLN